METNIPQTFIENPNIFSSANYNSNYNSQSNNFQNSNKYNSIRTPFQQPSSSRSLFSSQKYNNYMTPQTPQTQNNYNSLNYSNQYYPNQRFQWNEILRVNPNDSHSVEPYLDNLLYSSLDKREIDTLPGNNIVQLVNVLQGVAKNTINNQMNLQKQNYNLNNKINSMSSNQINNFKSYNDKNKNEIKHLKKKNKEQEQLINTYRKVLEGNEKYSKLIDDDDDVESEKNDRSKQRFYCQFCANKKFYTEQYLEDHMRRRHLNYYQKFISKMNKQPDYDSKLNDMKTYFENMITNNQLRNDYYRLNEKLNGLENLINSQNREIMIPSNQNYNPNKETIVYKTGKKNNIIYEDDNDLISRDDEKIIINNMNEIQKNLDKNKKNFQDKYNDMIDHMKQFQSKVKKELSSIKQMQSSIRGKELINSINLSNDTQYIAPQRREFRMSTLKNSQVDRNQLLNSIRNSENFNLINSGYKISNTFEINDKTINKNQNNNIPDNLKSIKLSESIKIDNKDNTNLRGGNENNILFKSNINDDDIEGQTEEEKELQQFYYNYMKRDKNINNHISSFLVRTIPNNKNLDENIIINNREHSISDKIYEASNSNANNELDLKRIKNENLFDIIDKLYSEIGDECAKDDFYGLHCRNINGLLNIDEIIDNAHNEHYGFKENKKKIQRDYIDPNNFTETIQYDIKSSNDSFSFNK
jgi:hypothetical protein